MEYIVITISSGVYTSAVSDIRDRVNRKIREGYKPLGNLSVVERSGVFYFAQAMIKEE